MQSADKLNHQILVVRCQVLWGSGVTPVGFPALSPLPSIGEPYVRMKSANYKGRILLKDPS